MGLLSRERGVRFERAIARRLRRMGFDVRRIDESYIGAGFDLVVYVQGRRLAAIQCKASGRRRDLECGWDQVHRAPYPILVCIHAHHKPLGGVTHRAIWARRGEQPIRGTLGEFLEFLASASSPTS